MDIQIIKYIVGILSGGIIVKIYERFFASKKDDNDFKIKLMERMESFTEKAFSRIGSLENEITNWKAKNEKLQEEYDDLKTKYYLLKKDFDTLKSKSE